MNLNLRNLLGWLDDALTPDQSAEFGRITFSDEILLLIARILRLNHGSLRIDSSHDDPDPNLLCEYLEDMLSPDEVLEVERRCIESDPLLAELAGVHRAVYQIRQKREFAPELRARMYDLGPPDPMDA